MTCRLSKVLPIVFAALLAASVASGQVAPAGAPAGGSATPKPEAVPALADLVSRASDLARRYATLQATVGGKRDVSGVQKGLGAWADKISRLAGRLDALKASGRYRYEQLTEIRTAARDAIKALKDLTSPLSDELSALEGLQKQWQAEAARWQGWESGLRGNGSLPALRQTLDEAKKTVAAALDLLSKAQVPLLEVQSRAGELSARALAIDAEAGTLLDAVRGSLFRKTGPPILSLEFLRKVRGLGWSALLKGLSEVSWPDRSFFSSAGWVALLQVVLCFLLCRALLGRRDLLRESERWAFLKNRPVAAGLFVGVAAPAPLYGPLPPTWNLLLWTVAAPAAARLVAGLITLPWKRRLLYALAALFWLSQLFRVAGLPEPLFRIYVSLVAVVGLPLAVWRARESAHREDSSFYTWALRLGAVVFAVVIGAQVGGFSNLAIQLLEASIETTFLILLAWMLALLLRGGLEFALRTSLLRRFPGVRDHFIIIGRRLGFAIDLVVGGLTLGVVLEVWRVYDTPTDALKSLLTAEISVGSYRFTPGLLLLAVIVLYGAFVTSWAVQALVTDGTLLPTHLEPAARISVNRLVHYAFVLVGFLAALSTLGIELRNLTILAGAFGIGIGFGLQNIVNNFVSGLILLFERPVKVGDVVQVGGQWAQIKSLGLRSTVIRTYDQSEIIVPNSELVSNQVTNWTLTDRQARIVVPVGVAYGSDVPRVMSILSAVAVEHRSVLESPAPQVLFMDFGASSLDFELRVWIGDVMDRPAIKSELLQEIDRRFREADVEISFPQRDLHLRSIDAPAAAALLRASPSPPGAPNGSRDASDERSGVDR